MRLVALLAASLIVLVTASCGGGGSTPIIPTPSTGAKWTVMIYLDADNNLGPESNLDLEEMMAVGSTSNVNVIVQHDLVGSPTVRYKVGKGKLNLLGSLGELDMAKPDTLRDFVVYSIQNYPADHYALIIWDHGSGWKGASPLLTFKSIFIDQDNGTLTPLSNYYVRQALVEARNSTGKTIDILGIDACEMAVLEAAYEFRSVAGIMVASQELVSGYGWDYDDLLSRLTLAPSMTPKELSVSMVDSFKKFYSASVYKDQTISALALQSQFSNDGVSDIGTVAVAVNDLSNRLIGLMSSSDTRASTLSLLTTTRDSVQEFDPTSSPGTYIDLVDFCRYVDGTGSATELALNRILLAEYHGTDRPKAHGLSIVFYDRTSIYDDVVYDPNYRNYNPSTGVGSLIAFLNEFNWDDMLHTYYGLQYPDKPN